MKNHLATCLTALAMLGPTAAHAQFRGIIVYENLAGPDGTPRAHVGDTVTANIGVINEDDFMDTITILSVTNIVQHGTGDTFTTNQLAAPVILHSYLVVSANPRYMLNRLAFDVVLPEDGDYLFSYADVRGTINFDGPGGTFVPEGFEALMGDEVRILRPALQLTLNADGTGSVSNSGNTLLSLSISNFLNGQPYTLGPTNLSAGASLNVGTVGSLFAWGTDELGLTVYDSLLAAPVIQAAPQAGGGILLTWSTQPGKAYQVQSTSSLLSLDWKNAGEPVVAFGPSASFLDFASETARFYRLVLLPSQP